jgi:hypothetical protein
MTYELAKELKDAGFSQKQFGNAHYILDGKEPCFTPTLSELIEACGDNLDNIRAPFGDPDDNDGSDFDIEWRAFSNRIDFRTAIYTKVQGAGSTPEEAVAKLWLALNAKT